MSSKLLNQIIMVSKYSLYGILLQAIFYSFALANSGNAQAKKLADIYISVDWEKTPLGSAIADLEGKTQFEFSYNEGFVDLQQEVNIYRSQGAMDQVLLDMAKQTNVKFKRINETIHVNTATKKEKTRTLLTEIIERTITGKVSGEDNEPLPGANVLVKGTTIGTVTDVDGNYALEVPDDANTLVFSFVGYLAAEVIIGNKSVIEVQLSPDIETLSEIVVVGYGTQKKENLTGAVSAVTSEMLDSRPITNVATGLQGTTTGVFINQNSGQPGNDDLFIRIRGTGTLNNANPLILVDGIEAPLGNINPQDIESMTVLKDAASAAIYGSRAANGVILITTKRGKVNSKPTFTYDGYYGSQEAIRLPEMVNDGHLYMTMRNEAETNFGNPEFYSPEQLAEAQTRANEINTNWVDELFQTAPIQQHTFSMAGGSESTNFRFSLGYLDQEGTVIRSDFKRYNARLNLDSKINDKVTVGTSLSLIRGDQNGSNEQLSDLSSVFTRAIQALPLFPVRDSEGRWAGPSVAAVGDSRTNPIAEAHGLDFNVISNDVLGNAYLEYEPIVGLKLKGTVAANYRTRDEESFNSKTPMYDFITGDNNVTIGDPRSASRRHWQTLNITTWLTATYTRSFGDHNLTALAGFNQETSDTRDFRAGRTGHLSNSVRVLDVGMPLVQPTKDRPPNGPFNRILAGLTMITRASTCLKPT